MIDPISVHVKEKTAGISPRYHPVPLHDIRPVERRSHLDASEGEGECTTDMHCVARNALFSEVMTYFVIRYNRGACPGSDGDSIAQMISVSVGNEDIAYIRELTLGRRGARRISRKKRIYQKHRILPPNLECRMSEIP